MQYNALSRWSSQRLSMVRHYTEICTISYYGRKVFSILWQYMAYPNWILVKFCFPCCMWVKGKYMRGQVVGGCLIGMKPCAVKGIWYPDWLVSSQCLVKFESVTIKVNLTIFLWLCAGTSLFLASLLASIIDQWHLVTDIDHFLLLGIPVFYGWFATHILHSVVSRVLHAL